MISLSICDVMKQNELFVARPQNRLFFQIFFFLFFFFHSESFIFSLFIRLCLIESLFTVLLAEAKIAGLIVVETAWATWS